MARSEPLRLAFKGRTTSETNHESPGLLECWICLGEVVEATKDVHVCRTVLSGTALDDLAENTAPKRFKKKPKTWNGINGTFRQEQNTGHETQEIKFSFPLDTYPETKAREAKRNKDRET